MPSARLSWPLLVVALALVPIAGVFTTTKIFFVRDLSFFFWSRHLWLRDTLYAGRAPWWDPFVAGGQSAIADALNQLLMPVTVAIRLLPSDVVAFNLWVALPLPIAGLGTFYFLRQRVPPAAAALGACVFALSGPIVSMLNTPNLSWSVALMPWLFATVEAWLAAPGSRRFVAIAVMFALQALCGEPVTWVATGALVAAYAFFRPKAEVPRGTVASATTGSVASASTRSVSSAFRRKTLVVGALAAGALLAAAQLVPTAMAGMRANRAALATPDFWSLHPVALWETVTPNVFGNYYDAFLADLPWMGALNFGRDPFFYSLYVGPFVVLLALVGVAARFRRSAFWACVAILFVVAALGGYTPLYPLLRKLVPPLLYFRFPVKYVVFAVFACAVLAAEGWASLADRAERASEGTHGATALTAVAVLGLAVAIAALMMPDVSTRVAHWLAMSTHLKEPAAGAAFLARTAPPLLVRLFAMLLAGCALVWFSRLRPERATAILFVATCADLAVTNAGLNLTTAVAKLAPPAWYTASEGSQRVYVGGRVRGHMNTSDRDATTSWEIPAETSAIEGRMVLNAELPMAPSGFRVREALSYDLPYLWPAEYEAAVKQFERSGPEARHAFLRRSGVRRCVLPEAEPRQFHVVADVPGWKMGVFDCDPGATRLFVATEVGIARDADDFAWQRHALFDTSLADTVVRIPALPPPPAGRPGPPAMPSLRIVEDGTTRVVIEAALRQPGMLVLRDSFDPSWIAEVDGEPAQIVRANSLYRAVSLPAGRHVIRFSYRPRDLGTGLIISMVTGAFLAFVALRKTRVRNASGFTLIELMIVLAIVAVLLSIAFNQYRGMQARGNDASAVGSLRSIAAAQWQFALTCGNMKYATTLPALAQPVPATGQGFLSPDLTSAETFEKSGYQFQMTAKPLDSGPQACNGATVAEGYAATADPMKPGITGNYFYGVNADRVLYLDQEKTFTGNLPESGPGGHGGEVR